MCKLWQLHNLGCGGPITLSVTGPCSSLQAGPSFIPAVFLLILET